MTFRKNASAGFSKRTWNSTPDPMTQAIFAAPMLGLYLLSIVIAWLVGPKRRKDDDEA